MNQFGLTYRSTVGLPLLIFAIYSHFDVKREYNAGTGEQTNVIAENTTDRPWEERQYMRVDWSTNHADPPEVTFTDPTASPWLVTKSIPSDWHVSETMAEIGRAHV